MSQPSDAGPKEADPILSLLQTHPVSRKDNLIKIAEALGLDNVAKDRKTELVLKIENRLAEEPQDEPMVRDIAVTILREHEEAKATKRITRGHSQSSATLDRSPTMVISAPSPTSEDAETQNLFDDSVISEAADLSTARKTPSSHLSAPPLAQILGRWAKKKTWRK